MKWLKRNWPFIFFAISLLLFALSMIANNHYFRRLSNGNVCLYQLTQVGSILFLYTIGYLFIKAIRHKLDDLFTCLMAFPAGICLWCFMSQFLLLADFTYRFLRVLFLMAAFILLCYFIRRRLIMPPQDLKFPKRKTLCVIIGAACLVSTGCSYIILNYDSYFYFSDYGKALTLMMSYKDIVSDNSFVLTNIGQFLPLVSSYATYFGLDSMVHLQGFMILDVLAAYAVCIYRYARIHFPAVRCGLYTVLFTFMLVSCSAFFIFTNWLLSNTWIMFYLFFLFILGMPALPGGIRIYESQPNNPASRREPRKIGPGVDICLLLCGFSGTVTMLRKDGIVIVCFLFICYSIWLFHANPSANALAEFSPASSLSMRLKKFRRFFADSLLPTLLFLPSALYQLFYIYYLRHILYAKTTLAFGTSLLSDNFMKMLLLSIAATLLYLLFLHRPAHKILGKYLPHAVTAVLLLGLVLFAVRDIGRFIDYTDSWIRNLGGTAFGYSILGILMLAVLILLSRPSYDYSLFMVVGYTLLTLIIYWNKGNTETNIDNSGLRALYQILPVFFCAAAFRVGALFSSRQSET